MVSLVITLVVIALAFSVLTLVQKQMGGIEANLEKGTQLELLEQSLWLDFHRFNKLGYSGLENELKFSNELDSITYQFTGDQVIKGVDTFKVPLKVWQPLFLNKETQNGTIDALLLETTQGKRVFIYKGNDANQFMQ